MANDFFSLTSRVTVVYTENVSNLACRLYVTPNTERGILELNSFISPTIVLDSLLT